MFKTILSKSVKKALLKLPGKHFKQIDTKLLELRQNPYPQDAKKLKGYKDLLRVDSGEYRIIYRVNHEAIEIYILAIGKRNDSEAYRSIKNL